MNRNWPASALMRWARTAPDWDNFAGATYKNPYNWLAELWGDWSSGDTIDSRIALVSGSRMGEIAPGLMPFPRGGWGFITASGTLASRLTDTNLPDSTPVVTISGTLETSSIDLDKVTLTASGTLTRELDRRTVRFLRPTFVRRVA